MQPEQKSFFQKYKKEIIIVSLAILVFGLLLYFLFFYNKRSSSLSNQNTNQTQSGFSFGKLIDSIFGNNDQNTDPNIIDENGDGVADYYFESLIKVWDKPVAGYGYYYKLYTYKYTDENGIEQTATDTKTMLQFIDSATGFVYEKDLLAPTSSPVQVTITPFPNVVRAYFLNDRDGYKSRVFMQYADANNTIKTVSATIPTYYGSTANMMNSAVLPDNIKNIAVSVDNKKLVYTVEKTKNTGGRLDIYTDWYYIDNINDTYGKRIYTSELSSWKLNVLNSGEIYAYTGDTAYDTNSLYKLTLNKSGLGSISQIYSNHTGMNFNINKNSLLVSIFTGSGLKTYKNSSWIGKSFNDNNLSPLSFTTLVNKCTQNDNYDDNLIICSVPKEIKNYEYGLPDAWYQGMTSWRDNLYLVNQDYPSGQLLFDINLDGQVNENMDAKNLQINNFKSHLGFINKNDGSLWTLNIGNILDEGGD